MVLLKYTVRGCGYHPRSRFEKIDANWKSDRRTDQAIAYIVEMYGADLPPAPFVWAAMNNHRERMQQLLEEQADDLPSYDSRETKYKSKKRQFC